MNAHGETIRPGAFRKTLAEHKRAIEMSLEFKSIDDIERIGRRYFSAKLADIRDELPENMQSIGVVVVGWSDRRNCAVGFEYEITAEGDAFEEIDEWMTAPAPSEAEEQILNGLGCDLEVNLFVPGLDPIRHGIPIMEAQRRTKVELQDVPGAEAIHIVGCNVQLTEVTKEGISQRIVHRWNDAAGEMIEPEPFARPAPLSRADRRRLERAPA